MIVIANGRFHAGGMLMAPMASMTDGKLEILIVNDVPKRTLLTSLLPKVYRGRHMGHPAVQHLSGEEIEVHAATELPFEVDGEQPGTTDIRAIVLPKVLRVRAAACR
jgi:diacylglycerol kinase family enzyme